MCYHLYVVWYANKLTLWFWHLSLLRYPPPLLFLQTIWILVRLFNIRKKHQFSGHSSIFITSFPPQTHAVSQDLWFQCKSLMCQLLSERSPTDFYNDLLFAVMYKGIIIFPSLVIDVCAGHSRVTPI